MSTLAHERRAARSQRERQKASARRRERQPYIVMNGATMVSIAAVAITIIGLLYLIQTSEVAQLGYDMARLQSQRESLSLEISELEYELARHESLHTVEDVAVDRLGMTELSNYEFVQVQEPAERDLSVPEPVPKEEPTAFERIVDAVLGVGAASSSQAEPADESDPEVRP